jgi:hypothetical protein
MLASTGDVFCAFTRTSACSLPPSTGRVHRISPPCWRNADTVLMTAPSTCCASRGKYSIDW